MTEQEFTERIEKAALITWDAIAEEYIKLSEECGDGDSVERDEVVDAVATHLNTYGNDEEVVNNLFERPLKEQIKILRGVFRFATYS